MSCWRSDVGLISIGSRAIVGAGSRQYFSSGTDERFVTMVGSFIHKPGNLNIGGGSSVVVIQCRCSGVVIWDDDLLSISSIVLGCRLHCNHWFLINLL